MGQPLPIFDYDMTRPRGYFSKPEHADLRNAKNNAALVTEPLSHSAIFRVYQLLFKRDVPLLCRRVIANLSEPLFLGTLGA